LSDIRGPVRLEVEGCIPRWVSGTLYRTGPGQFSFEETAKGTYEISHWFDGLAQAHKFDIIADTATPEAPIRVEYSSRGLVPALAKYIQKHGQHPGFSFGQRRDPCIGIFGKFMSVWKMPFPKRMPDQENVLVSVHANLPGLSSNARPVSRPGYQSGTKDIWLASDTNCLREIDQDTLEPIGFAIQSNLHPQLKGPLSCAHMQRDPITGDMFNQNLEMGRIATYRIFRTNAVTGTTDILASISQPDIKPAYVHSFFLSPSFVIICVPSSHLSHMGLAVLWHRNLIDAIEPFDPSQVSKWLIIDRKGKRGVVASFDGPSCFFFHSINSFEEIDDKTGVTSVFCDLIEYPTTDILRGFEIGILSNESGAGSEFWNNKTRARGLLPRFARHQFRFSNLEVETTQVKLRHPSTHEIPISIKAPHAGDLPTINPAFHTRQYRYFYSLPNRGYSTLCDCIAKTDIYTREVLYWNGPQGHTPSEPIFVARPSSEADGEKELDEDNGVLLSIVLNGLLRTSYLICLDARTMTELGRAQCQWAISLGFHGLHSAASGKQI
jgi:torulene dioxygenase